MCFVFKLKTKQCKYTLKNYKSASKCMKLKFTDYLKENNMEFYLCRICGEIVNKSHFDSEEHIKKFNRVCDIEIKKSFQKSFISIKSQFIDARCNYVYTDLYFKKHIKDITLSKCWSHIAPFSRLYLVKLKVAVQLKSQQ